VGSHVSISCRNDAYDASTKIIEELDLRSGLFIRSAVTSFVALTVLLSTTNSYHPHLLPFAAAMSAASPPSLKLYYADMAFWRAECVRVAFFLGDVPFEDIRDLSMDDMKNSGKLTFGALPVLEVDGKILSQTQPIAVYAAKLAGIHPDDPWLAAKVDECINGCTDATVTISNTFRLPADEKIPAREAMIAEGGGLRMHLSGLEKICLENGDCGFSVGSSITVADLAIWRLMGWLSSGTLDGIPADYVAKTFPSISKVVDGVDANAKVQEWKAKYARFYPEHKKRKLSQ
jgi:prostaglandin-H2 D-isomerase / glutathione transferase